jgi:hypothetical protein
VTAYVATPSLSQPKALQALLDDPNLLFVKPIPSAAKIVRGKDLNRGNDCSA